MSIRRTAPLPLICALAVLGVPQPLVAGGLACSIGEVVIENLKIGHSYSLQALANLPLAVTNTGDRAVRVSIDPLIPDSSELRQGAEAIPHLGWASATPETMGLAPGETKAATLMLTIPDDEGLLGRKFQVGFWSHTQPLPGDALAFGLKSRVIFTIDLERDPAGAAPSGDLSLTLLPAEVRLGRLAAGREVHIEDAGTGPFRIRNTSRRSLTVEVRALDERAAGIELAEGCGDLVHAAKVTLTPATFTLAPGEERTIGGTVSMGRVKGLKGKDLIGVVSACITNQPVKTCVCSRISAHAP